MMQQHKCGKGGQQVAAREHEYGESCARGPIGFEGVYFRTLSDDPDGCVGEFSFAMGS